jgi:predicted HTH domain antitoxin
MIRAARATEGSTMVELRMQVSEGALAALRKDPDAFGREMRIAAAVLWYERRQVSQGRAAEIAGLSRAEFIDALSRYGVSPFQYESADDLVAEAERA